MVPAAVSKYPAKAPEDKETPVEGDAVHNGGTAAGDPMVTWA